MGCEANIQIDIMSGFNAIFLHVQFFFLEIFMRCHILLKVTPFSVTYIESKWVTQYYYSHSIVLFTYLFSCYSQDIKFLHFSWSHLHCKKLSVQKLYSVLFAIKKRVELTVSKKQVTCILPFLQILWYMKKWMYDIKLAYNLTIPIFSKVWD